MIDGLSKKYLKEIPASIAADGVDNIQADNVCSPCPDGLGMGKL